MKQYLLFFIALLLVSCSSPKTKLEKYNLADTNIIINGYRFHDFHSPFSILEPEAAQGFATTETQKLAANALGYVIQGRYKDAADAFCKATMENDSLEVWWKWFPSLYYSNISHNWKSLEEYENIRKGITDSSFAFYKNFPNFNIEFIEDSVMIPIELSKGLPIAKIKINGKYYYFLIDTGFSNTTLGKSLADNTNVVYNSNKEKNIATVGGGLSVYDGFLPEIDLEKIKISNIPINVFTNQDGVSAKFLFITFFHCDGIIGWDLLQNFDFTIDYKNKQLVLRKPIEKNIEQKNLFWYEFPVIKFYASATGYPLLFHFDSGASRSSFDITKPFMFGIDTNYLKKTSETRYGAGGNSVKKQYYKYSYFQCFTLAGDMVSYLKSNDVLFEDLLQQHNGSIRIVGILGSDWFKDKAVRVDITNGIFEITE